MHIRLALPTDMDALVEMGRQMFPDAKNDREIRDTFHETFDRDTEVTFVALSEVGGYTGFAIFSLRADYVEGSSHRPTGYFEAVFVRKNLRRTGLASKLLAAGEGWCKDKGCKQMGSDAVIENGASHQFHKAAGFQEVERIVCFIKDL